MEELRLKGNSLFATNPAEAAEYYLKAVELYEGQKAGGPSFSLEEFTKSAGNALTCLYKLGETEQCAAVAQRILSINPSLAKAYGFYGRCLLEDPSIDVGVGSRAPSLALMSLCRGIYTLPSLSPVLGSSLDDAITRLMQDKLTTLNQFNQGTDGVRVAEVAYGRGVVAMQRLPAAVQVATLNTPFSVGSYEETNGHGCCIECSLPIDPSNTAAEEKEAPPKNVEKGVNTDGDEDEAEESNEPEETTGALLHGCPACDMVAYCSAECRDKHQSQHDQHECALLLRLKEMMAAMKEGKKPVPDEFFELAYHTITTIAAIKAERVGHDRVLNLTSHAQEVVQALHPIGQMMEALLSDVGNAAIIHQIIGILRCNALEVSDESGLGVGQALHFGENIVTFLNHSCIPNCSIDPVNQCIITSRVIEIGEELTIAYIPQLYWPTKLRRERLSEGFFFTCHCPRCTDGEKDPMERVLCMEVPGCRKGAASHHHALVQLQCSRVRAKAVSEVSTKDANDLEAMLKELEKHFFSFHYLCHEVRNCLSFVYAVLADEENCLKNCLQELLLWECVIPGGMPVKHMKLQNAMQCMQHLAKPPSDPPALYPFVNRLALLYEVE